MHKIKIKKSKIGLSFWWVLVLLLVYLSGSLPLSVFHHHESGIIPLEKASNCEKEIYYPGFNDLCKHQTHISATLEKCSLCVHHIIPVHATEPASYSVSESLHIFYFSSYLPGLRTIFSLFHEVRGPPTDITSFT